MSWAPAATQLDGASFDEVIAAIDAANAEDPNQLEARGSAGPKELRHSELMTEWVLRLDPRADGAQLVAARAHHLRRWTRPRTDYPDGRSGYLRWRTAAKQAHAAEVGAILDAHGATPDFVERVSAIVTKKGLGTDPAVQTHEDALCLVFLETQLDDLLADLGHDRTVEILRKSVAKMSPAGIDAAAAVELSGPGGAALADAVSGGDDG